MTSVLSRDRWGEHRGRDWRDTATSQRTREEDSPQEPFDRVQPYPHLNFRLPASKTVREPNSINLSHQICGNSFSQPLDTNVVSNAESLGRCWHVTSAQQMVPHLSARAPQGVNICIIPGGFWESVTRQQGHAVSLSPCKTEAWPEFC